MESQWMESQWMESQRMRCWMGWWGFLGWFCGFGLLIRFALFRHCPLASLKASLKQLDHGGYVGCFCHAYSLPRQVRTTSNGLRQAVRDDPLCLTCQIGVH